MAAIALSTGATYWGRTPQGKLVRLTDVQESPPPLALNLNRLSSVAFAILRAAPASFRNGQALSLRTWAALTGYTHTHVRRGLRELAHWGLIETVPYGQRKQRYVGADLLWHPAVLALAG